jgi:hypothetical protein
MRLTGVARTTILLSAALALAACAVRVGGGGPRGFDVVALRADGQDAAEAVAARIGAANADIVLLSAERDSAWFAAVATAARLSLSGPGATGGIGLAFLTNLEIVGDTSLVLEVPEGGSVHMQDALYRIHGNRFIDLMTVRFDAPDLRAAVRRLLDYVARDVGADVPVLLAVDGVTPQAADSAAILMRAYYNSEAGCPGGDVPDAAGLPVRLLYGPSARIMCRDSRLLPGEPPATAIRAVIGR